MAYGRQTELDLLIQQCDDMEESINEAGIWALNYIDDLAEAYNDSSANILITDERWIKLCQDFGTFFRINSDEKNKDEFEVLKQRTQIVTKDVLASIRVLINAIKNDLKVREESNNLATDADKLHELVVKIKDVRKNPKYSSMARKSSLFLKPGENPNVEIPNYSGTQTFILWAEDLKLFLNGCSIKDSKQVAEIIELLDSFKGFGEETKLDKIEAMLMSLEKNYSKIEELETEINMKTSILSRFPTETLTFHKTSGENYEIIGLVGTDNTIMSEDTSIPIEPDDYFERKLPNGIIEYFKVVDTGYIPGTPGIPEHYQTKVQKVKANELFIDSNHMNMEDEKLGMTNRNQIFISHRTTDALVADMIKDFLVNTGIPNESVFCSSLPGNDVNEKISPEVKERLKKCTIIILILSKDYYDSPYCLNEAGIAWYLDEVVSIPIGMPEIDHNKMIGFLNSDYKLRRLDNDGDISYLYDTAQEKLQAENKKHSVITQETKKLKEKYSDYISKRKSFNSDASDTQDAIETVSIEIDEGVLLVYAAEDKGEILVSGSISRSGPSVEAGGYDFSEEDTPRECARWKAAVEKLEKYGLIECPKYDGKYYRVTALGFTVADQAKEKWKIDVSKSPKDNL